MKFLESENKERKVNGAGSTKITSLSDLEQIALKSAQLPSDCKSSAGSEDTCCWGDSDSCGEPSCSSV